MIRLCCIVNSIYSCKMCGKRSGCLKHFTKKIKKRRRRVKKSIKCWYKVDPLWSFTSRSSFSYTPPPQKNEILGPLCYNCYNEELDRILREAKKRK